MLVARTRFRKLMQQTKPRSRRVRVEADRYTRTSGCDRLAARITECEHDPLGSAHVQHFARSFGSVGIANVHLTPRLGVDSRTGAPPVGPSVTIGEKSKNGLQLCFDDDGSVQVVWQIVHKSSVVHKFSWVSFLAA